MVNDLKPLSTRDNKLVDEKKNLTDFIKTSAMVFTGAAVLAAIFYHTKVNQATDFVKKLKESPTIACTYQGELIENFAAGEGLSYGDIDDYTKYFRKINNLKPGEMPKIGDSLTVVDYNKDGEAAFGNCPAR